MNGIENTKKEMPILTNDERLYVYLQGNHFQQNDVLTSSNDHVINKMTQMTPLYTTSGPDDPIGLVGKLCLLGSRSKFPI